MLLVPPTLGVALAPGSRRSSLPRAPGALHAGACWRSAHRTSSRRSCRGSSAGDGLLRVGARRREASSGGCGVALASTVVGLAGCDRRPRRAPARRRDRDARGLPDTGLTAPRRRHRATSHETRACSALGRRRRAVLHVRRHLHVRHLPAGGAAVLRTRSAAASLVFLLWLTGLAGPLAGTELQNGSAGGGLRSAWSSSPALVSC